MLRRCAGAAVAALGVLTCAVATAAPAAAGPVDDAVAGLRDSSVFLDPASGRELDVDALRGRIGDRPIKIAILPEGPGTSEVRTWPREISAALPGNTVAVIAGRYFYAGSDVLCNGVAGRAATNAIAKHNTDLDQEANSDLTTALTDFVAELSAAPRCGNDGGAGRGDRYADEPGGGEAFAGAGEDAASALPYVAAGLAVGVLGIGTWVLLARRRAAARASRRRDEARGLVARLDAEVGGLAAVDGQGDPAAQRAVHDARAKHAEAQALLLGATTDVQYAAVRHAAIEGLIAARAARGGHGEPIPAFDPPIMAPAEPSGTPAP